jgi:GMP synthase (glutamine-hydrolysing)
MKTVLVLQHVPHEMLGTVGPALTAAGFDSRYINLYDAVPDRLDLTRASGLVVLGGPMNVDQTDRYPFLDAEVDWIRQAVAAETPVLGICLGAQLLAKALGARVYANGRKEIGWYRADRTAAAASDRLFAGCQETLTVFQWHGDTFDLPAGAVHLFHSEECRNQAFRYRQSAYGLQFHIEMTAAMIDDWLSEAGNTRELAGLDYIDPQVIRARTPQELPAMQRLSQQVFGRFAEMCQAARPSWP